MKTINTHSERLGEDACLPHIASLHGAILDTLVSLGDGSLEHFEDSLWKQQLLCANLQHSVDLLRHGVPDTASLDRVLSALRALHVLSRTYASAITQASATTEMLSNLVEAYQYSGVGLSASLLRGEPGRVTACTA